MFTKRQRAVYRRFEPDRVTQTTPAGGTGACRIQQGHILGGGPYLKANPPSNGHRLSLSPEIAIGVVKAMDFCLVLISSAGALALYQGAAMYSAAERELNV